MSRDRAGPTYCLEFILQVAEPVGTIVGVLNVFTRNFQFAAGRSQDEVDQICHSTGFVFVECSEPFFGSFFQRLASCEHLGCMLKSDLVCVTCVYVPEPTVKTSYLFCNSLVHALGFLRATLLASCSDR